jgi:hypothetical protein
VPTYTYLEVDKPQRHVAMAPIIFQNGLIISSLHLFLHYQKSTLNDDCAAQLLISDSEHS